MTSYFNTSDGQPTHGKDSCPYRFHGYCGACVPIDIKTEVGMYRYWLDGSREETRQVQRGADMWRKVLDDEGRELAEALGWNPDQYTISFGWDQMLAAVRELTTQSDDVEEERESANSQGDLGTS